ncbi:cyclin-dependent kinase regulatory subunit CKS1 [Angomonas deanei]|uniref:Cyclin-dependent kinases regulatory subunit n=1 Tax=Angomonas deanei TaxID=59799 RepID=S9ULJ0_9TRYP|nr:cyclin-dependent kinase regulatory subunit CKS1 [Angomonas deanei]EPY38837.1 cyclin-dependent kinase regulatory subunit CKS1 [Angomonas deanei]EPY43526.1 cyclin-dependent kinase regulatory subunit CKS1 [Angomonas deanei]CAD2215962.1 Cyclin-dependent kinase regulatory subunit, putative [Angomonas deanei]|eukprot:EPY29823.1 cyclin-dependent kinase regulatory subunit CKS1 [Angomonas deanei]
MPPQPDYFSLDPKTQMETSALIKKLQSRIVYSDKYYDDVFEYRHVILPKDLVKLLPRRLMSERELRMLGVQQSPGWEHYMIHKPEPHVLLFKRKITS